jgi:hypothetical protein
LKELMSIKDIFINEESNDEKPNSNNRTKNWYYIQWSS